MNSEDLKKKLELLANDQSFISKLQPVKSKEELQNVLSEFGIDLTREEIDAFAANVESLMSNGDVSEVELEKVSGGGVSAWSIFSTVVSWGKPIWEKCWNAGKSFLAWESSVGKKKR